MSTSAALESMVTEIKEYQFQLYFQDATKCCESAVAILSKLNELIDHGYVIVVSQNVPGRIHPGPSGHHHVIGSFEVRCPIEIFARTFSWFTLNRDNHCHATTPSRVHQIQVRNHSLGE
ncbi:hypothetical protein BGZ81_007168 [Podila clonocystis]|nr:hypothetical protein BGZ81_007168 [Podila clonocystis]